MSAPQSTYFTVRGQSKILTPHPHSPPGECVIPALVAGGGQTRRAEMGGGGSIFWKTREIGLPSYSKICTLWSAPWLYLPASPLPSYSSYLFLNFLLLDILLLLGQRVDMGLQQGGGTAAAALT
jgi:hypothetical protein